MRAPGIATIGRMEVEQPREGDLGRCRCVTIRDGSHAVEAVEAPGPTRPSERGVGEERDPVLRAPVDDPAAERR